MLLNILYRLRTYHVNVKTRKLVLQLNKDIEFQTDRYNSIQEEFAKYYEAVNDSKESKFILPKWRDENISLSRRFLPCPNYNFLQSPVILRTMFVASEGVLLKHQLKYLESVMPVKILKKILKEDSFGAPLLIKSKYLTSHNSIHHLYHIVKYFEGNRIKLLKNDVVIEWGGGYGSLAKLLRRYASDLNLTYVLIDSSLFSCLQWLYLSVIFGEDEVNLVTSKNCKIIKGKINILPLSFVKDYKLVANHFISTWALSESSKYSQDFVLSRQWFGAKNVLLAFQKSSKSFPYADRLESKIIESGGSVEEIPHLPNNYYGYLY